MTTPFAQPSAGGDQFEPKDYLGALLLIYPKSYNPNATTKHGPSTSADVDVVVVDRPDATGQPTIMRNARLFGNLANSVRDSLGSQVLGRLAQVPTNKGNPAWVLDNYTDADAAVAGPVHTAWTAGQFKPPAAPQSANAQASAAQDPWAGMNAAPAPPPQQYAAPPAVPGAPAAAPADPNITLLIGKGLDPAQVVAMDPATRAAVAATYGG